MTTENFSLFNLISARNVFEMGHNVTEVLRQQINSKCNNSDIIETAYALQAGTYIARTLENMANAEKFCAELSGILDKNLDYNDKLVDIGSGELTTISIVLKNIIQKPDNSWF